MESMNIMINEMSKEKVKSIMPRLLELEHNWTGIGDTAWTKENFEMELPGKFEISKYASAEGKVVGYYIASLNGEKAKLNKIITDLEFRGKGIGEKLWQELLKECRKRKLEKIEFKVITDNETSIRFYKKRGCLFDGTTSKGTDNKERYNIQYIFRVSKGILHSKPTISNEDIENVSEALKSGNITTGKIVKEFASMLSELTGMKYGTATSSGTTAIHLALRALGIDKEDEVIIPSYVCGAILSPIQACNAKAVAVDINKDDLNISYENTKKAITKKTKAIILPHMFGKPIQDIEKFKELKIKIIEDNALSIGAKHNGKRVGSFGDISVFSFYSTKVMTTGVGGTIMTNNKEIQKKVEDLVKYDNRESMGESYNYKMCDMQAALGISQIKKLDKMISRRKEIARKYTELFRNAEINCLYPEEEEENIFFRYIIQTEKRDEFITNMKKRGINAEKPVFKPIHEYMKKSEKLFPNTAKAYEKSVSIPIYPDLTDGDIENIAGAIINWEHENRGGVEL